MESVTIRARRSISSGSRTMTQEDKELLEQLSAEFSSNQIKKRKGAKNKMFSYINVHHIRERLDQVLGFRWNWEIVETRNTTFIKSGYYNKNTQQKSSDQEIQGVTVTGRLSIQLPSGITVFREGNGGASCDKGMGPGDAEKIASSNALKRAAWMFGIGKQLALDGEEAMDDVTINQSYGNSSNPVVNPIVAPAPGSIAPGTVAPGVVQPSSTGGPVVVNPAMTIINSNP